MSEVMASPRLLGYDELPEAGGCLLGPTSWTAVTQAQVGGFAPHTHDHHWLHVDAKRAQEFLESGRGALGRVGDASSVLMEAAPLCDFAVAWIERR